MGTAKPFLVSTTGVDHVAPSDDSFQDGAAQQLALWPEMEDELMALRKHVMVVKHAAKPVNTSRAWERDWQSFEEFCRRTRLPYLPSTTETVSLYCASELKAGRKVSTIRRRLWSIRGHHSDKGLPDPVTSEVSKLLTSRVRQTKEQPRQAEAITAEQFRAICSQLKKAGTQQCSRDRAALVIGFGAALRSAELCGLQLADVTTTAKGVAVKIRSSKADQEGKGATVHVFVGKHGATDVLDALKCWLAHRGKEPGPLFGFEPDTYRMLIKRSVALIGLDAALYSGHSLRSGAITAAMQSGADPFVVMRELSRHSDMKSFQRYVRKGQAWKINALAGVL
jgi:integrase